MSPHLLAAAVSLAFLVGCNKTESSQSSVGSVGSSAYTPRDLPAPRINLSPDVDYGSLPPLRSSIPQEIDLPARPASPGTSWTPKGSEYSYHQDGTTSWTPKGSEYSYHQDGTTSWTPKGSEYSYHQNGATSWTPKGSDYSYGQ
jgi:hypothetical protein